MTTVNNDELTYSLSGFPPQTSFLLTNPETRLTFTSIIIILKVYPVLILILGSLGNLLSFCVLLRANMRRYSTFCYLACLALVDLGVILTFCTNFISLYHFNNDIQNGPFACKLFAFCIYFLPQYSSWILVAVSIDRVISAKYLRLAKTWSKPRHSVLVTLILGLILGILNSHFFLYKNNSLEQQRIVQQNRTSIEQFLSSNPFLEQPTESFSLMYSYSSHDASSSSSSMSHRSYTPPPSIQRDTTFQQQADDNDGTIQQDINLSFDVNVIHCSLENSPEHEDLHRYWVWIDLLMNVFLPFTGNNPSSLSISLSRWFVAMIACTIIIILTLVRSSTRAGSTSARRSRRRRNISVMLITVNLVFITLTAPIVIFLSIYEYVKVKENFYRQTILILIKILCIILMHLNHSVNIIIYSVTAKEFRTEMVNFFHAILYCIIGKPMNPNDFALIHDDGTISSRFRRFRQNFFSSCRAKFYSNSPNNTDSDTVRHTRAAGSQARLSTYDNSSGTHVHKRKYSDRKSRRKSSGIRSSATSTTYRTSHRLTVQYQPDLASTALEREDLSLHALSISTED